MNVFLPLAVLLLPMVSAATEMSPLRARAIELMGTDTVFFVERRVYPDGHYYRNFGGDAADPSAWCHAPDGSGLYTLNLRTGARKPIFVVEKGDIRDPRINYEGTKFLFAYRAGGTHNYSLYELNVDGTNLKRLTFDNRFDDFGPEYLPDGGIIFCSSRGRRFIPCNHAPGAQIFRMNADGTGLLMLSANNVRDDRPQVMPNGQIVYDRWEYVDANIGLFHDIWLMNPDGTGQMIAFGGSVKEEYTALKLIYSKCDPRPIPNAPGKIVATFSPPSGCRENAGDLMVIDLKGGPDAFQNAKRVTPKQVYPYYGQVNDSSPYWGDFHGTRDPYPLDEHCILAANLRDLVLLDGANGSEALYTCANPKGPQLLVNDPRPLAPRKREPVIPPRTDLTKAYGTFVLSDVYKGRNDEMAGVKRGTIKELLILEDLPKPVSFYNLPGLVSMDGTHTLRRVLGTVPVEKDGSAAFEVPAIRGVYFVALDKNGLAVKRMQSYTMIMPGEVQGCVGCHEPRAVTQAPGAYAQSSTLDALRRKPSKIKPCAAAPLHGVFDYVRDIQPILDAACVKCHNPDKMSGRVNLCGDKCEWFTQSYYTLFARKQVHDMYGRYCYELREHKPYQFGTGDSPLLQKIDKHHHGVKLSQKDRDTVRLWIEASGTFPGTYAVYNQEFCGVTGVRPQTPRVMFGKPLDRITSIRCLICHDSEANLGVRVHKGRMNEPKHCWNLFDLTHPEKSMILLAPLEKEAGGYGWCHTDYGQHGAAFLTKDDPDWQAILKAIQAAKARMEADPTCRTDSPAFIPNPHYVRWMKNWRILPAGFDPKTDKIDCHETDEAYWESLWYNPSKPLPTATAGKAEALLEGKTLADFDFLLEDPSTRDAIFHLKNGMLKITAQKPAFLLTKKEYKNFELSFEVGYPTADFVDSGITLCLVPQDGQKPRVKGLEVQLKSTDIGDFWGCCGFRISGDAARFQSHVEAGTQDAYCRMKRLFELKRTGWIPMNITCVGDEVIVCADGRLLNRCVRADVSAGRIGFQTKPYPQGCAPILFRNVILTER